MSEQHLDPLAIAARLLERGRAHEIPGEIAGIFMDATWDFALRGIRTASGLQRAGATVRAPCAIKQCRPIVNVARRVQQLALRTDIDIARSVEGEVTPAPRAIFAPRLVDHRNLRRDSLLIDNPIERLGGAIGRIGGKVVRLESEALLSPFDHRLRRTNLSLTNGSGSLDINDDAELDINEIIIGIGKECWPAPRAGPLRGRIGRRHELRCHIARRTECRIVKGRQILPRGAARGRSKACLLPFGARDRALLVGISDNQARINRKALTADQAGCNTGFNDTLENPAEHIALTEPLMADA